MFMERTIRSVDAFPFSMAITASFKELRVLFIVSLIINAKTNTHREKANAMAASDPI